MGFLDEVVITVVSGDGGRGCVSFRRERFIPKGGPDGGNGGDGGAIIIRASNALHTLSEFSSKRYFKAGNGSPGKGKNRTGKNGPDTIIRVPVGTVVYDHDTGEFITDMVRSDQEMVVVSGGKGGKGNSHFATSTHRAPRFAQDGSPGYEKRLRLILKYIADVGIIGMPNAGKSTLLSRLTMARPKIGRYPFTTIFPNLGVMELEDQVFLTLADIPGLIEGASEGKGLGHRFLKHIERTRFLLHLIDIVETASDDPLKDFHRLRNELEKYNPSLNRKDQIVLINKIDLLQPERNNVEKIQTTLARSGFESLPISALTGEGLENLKEVLAKRFQQEIDGRELQDKQG
jgi:GTP-binding protein